MDRAELTKRYLEGQVSRRVFIRRLTTVGVSAVAAIAYADVLMSPPAAAAAGDFYILVFDYGFTPTPASVAQGQWVEWGFEYGNSHAHSASDTSGMKYFDSGFKPGGSNYRKPFIAAGRYPYHCKETTHAFAPMNGIVRVPILVEPTTGPVGTTFFVTWASESAPTGFVFDAQIKRPGAASFVDWRIGKTARRSAFKPTATGQYQFSARIRKLVNGAASGYSSGKTITVT